MRSLRQALQGFLASPGPNRVLRLAFDPVRSLAPRAILDRLPFVGEVRVPIPGAGTVRFQSDGRDWIVARLHWSGPRAFEPETTAVFDVLARDARVFYDVGAYSGWYAVRAAALPHRPAVHAFEAVPETFARLALHAKANDLGNLRAVLAAVGSEDGEIAIHVPRGAYHPTSASTRSGFRRDTETLRVPALRLDTYCGPAGHPRPDLLKIDVEGAEPEVLAGARETIGAGRPAILCEVLAGLTEARLEGFFGPLAYRAFHVSREGLVEQEAIRGDPTYRAMNYLFLPRERAEEVGDAVQARVRLLDEGRMAPYTAPRRR